MPKKKKIDNSIKEKRRIMEAEKAVMKTRFGTTYVLDPVTVTKTEKEHTTQDKFLLPVAHIKSDLIKNGLFMVFVVVVLVALKISGFTI